jgi:transposase
MVSAVILKKIKAAVLLSAGYPQVKVAKELGISTRTLQRWIKEKEDGFDALKK